MSKIATLKIRKHHRPNRTAETARVCASCGVTLHYGNEGRKAPHPNLFPIWGSWLGCGVLRPQSFWLGFGDGWGECTVARGRRHKSVERRADPQQIVRQSLLSCLQNPVLYLSRLQRIHLFQRSKLCFSATTAQIENRSECAIVWCWARRLIHIQSTSKKVNIVAFQHGFWLRGVQS